MKYKSIFISDLHLGNKFTQAEQLLKFLKKYKSENLFLVGDLIDGWAMKKKFKWYELHTKILQEILKKSQKGTKVYIITGNHDEFLRQFTPFNLGENIEVVDEFSYVLPNGKKYLVTHGDIFDGFIASTTWIPKFGAFLYKMLLNINFAFNKLFDFLKIKKKITFSKFVKNKIKRSVNFINDFEGVLAKYAEAENYDGVICGHIHKAEIRTIENIEYLNCGDFIESCTGLLETKQGEFEIFDFYKTPKF